MLITKKCFIHAIYRLSIDSIDFPSVNKVYYISFKFIHPVKLFFNVSPQPIKTITQTSISSL